MAVSKRRWRFYSTPAGRSPVRDFLEGLTDEDAAEVVAAMKEVAQLGQAAARHLRAEIYEARASGATQTFRVLFAAEGARGQVLLALEAFSKKTQRTPPAMIDLAEQRLRSWRARGRRG